MKYDFILFDADGTLFDFDRAERYSFQKTITDFKLPFSESMYEDYHIINDGLWKDFERGSIAKPDLLIERYRRLIAKYGLTADPFELNNLYLSTLGSCGYLLDGAVDICRELYDAGKKMYIVTNGATPVQVSRYNNSELKQYFRDIFISEAIGSPKPNKAFFDYVFAHIDGFIPERAIIIGDSLTSDIKGGNNAGIDTCWFNPNNIMNDRGVTCTYTIDNLDLLKSIV